MVERAKDTCCEGVSVEGLCKRLSEIYPPCVDNGDNLFARMMVQLFRYDTCPSCMQLVCRLLLHVAQLMCERIVDDVLPADMECLLDGRQAGRARQRRIDMDYKLYVVNEKVATNAVESGAQAMRCSGNDPSLARRWEIQSMQRHVGAMFRCFA